MGKRDGKAAKAKRAERRGKGSLKTEAKTAIAEGKQDRKKAFAKDEEDLDALRHGQSAVWALSRLGACATSGRVWRLWAAYHSQGEARPLGPQPLGPQPLPRLIELAAFTAADSTAFDPPGPRGGRGVAGAAAADARRPARRDARDGGVLARSSRLALPRLLACRMGGDSAAGSGHRFAAARVRVRAAFGDG